MRIDADIEVVTDGLSQCFDLSNGVAHGVVGPYQTVLRARKSCFRGRITSLLRLQKSLRRSRDIHIHANTVACGPAQKSVDRYVKCLSQDVPERNLDGADGGI